jgi:hypothetical protein
MEEKPSGLVRRMFPLQVLPDLQWVKNKIKNHVLLSAEGLLLLDRDPLDTSQFRTRLSSAGVTPIRLPPSSPNLNAYAERFVRSIQCECLSKLVLLGESHLRAAVREYVAHYHEERNHQGLDGQLLSPARQPRTGPDRSSVGSVLVGSCAATTGSGLKRPRSSFRTLRRCGL